MRFPVLIIIGCQVDLDLSLTQRAVRASMFGGQGLVGVLKGTEVAVFPAGAVSRESVNTVLSGQEFAYLSFLHTRAYV